MKNIEIVVSRSSEGVVRTAGCLVLSEIMLGQHLEWFQKCYESFNLHFSGFASFFTTVPRPARRDIPLHQKFEFVLNNLIM